MKAIVKSVFADKFLGIEHQIGSVIEIKDEARMNDLVSRGLVSKVEAVAEKKATHKKVSKVKE